MNKRLRKKKHKGEYTVYGFHLEFTTKERLSWDGPTGGFDGPGSIFSESLDEWAHAHGWCAAPGGNGKRWGAFVTPDYGREKFPHPGLTEKEQVEIVEYVRSLPEVDHIVAGPLVDAYGWEDKTWQEHCRIADETLGGYGTDPAVIKGA